MECIAKPEMIPEKSSARTATLLLPHWPEPLRGIPNSFLRSALFAAIQGKNRRFIERKALGSLQGTIVRFTGKQLDQSDLDVWEQAAHLARTHALGNVCYFRASSFLKALGRGNGKAQYEWLNQAIERLVGCFVEIRNGSLVFTGSLLSNCVRDEITGIYRLTFDPETIKLYGNNDWTAIEWKQRQKLRGKPLALWLHGFYSSHNEVCSMKIETLRELSGSTNKDEYDFRRKLKTALADIQKSVGITTIMDGDQVISRPRPSQARTVHLFAL